MKFRPSLDGFYKRSWEHNEQYETLKRQMKRTPTEYLARERVRLEDLLRKHVRECYADLHERTRHILSNPVWRRLILFSKWSSIERRILDNQQPYLFFLRDSDNDENAAVN